eukprot:COSAG05_NODE_1382_length_5019_cov_58.408740_3_plen_176_part_00
MSRAGACRRPCCSRSLSSVSVGRVAVEEGAVLTLRRHFTPADVAAFAALSGDENPLHLDADYARTTIFRRPIVHGMLTASLFPSIFATNFPGSIYLSQTLNFKGPVFVGESVTATVTVLSCRQMRGGTKVATCRTECEVTEGLQAEGILTSTQAGRLALEGEASVLCPMVTLSHS